MLLRGGFDRIDRPFPFLRGETKRVRTPSEKWKGERKKEEREVWVVWWRI